MAEQEKLARAQWEAGYMQALKDVSVLVKNC